MYKGARTQSEVLLFAMRPCMSVSIRFLPAVVKGFIENSHLQFRTQKAAQTGAKVAALQSKRKSNIRGLHFPLTMRMVSDKIPPTQGKGALWEFKAPLLFFLSKKARG